MSSQREITEGQNKKGKASNMKNRNIVFTATLVALACALGPVAQAAPIPQGGPARSATSKSANANSEAGAQFGMAENILPLASISFAPVGLTFGQTARLNLINMDVANGITISWSFIDAGGVTLAQSVTTLSLGKIASFDFQRGNSPPGESPALLRAEVRARIDIFTYGVSSDSLRSSLEVFNNDSGATTVYMGGAGS
jgi:hypothetical protein